MRNFVLYLPGRYPNSRLEFYVKLSRRACRVAVDGGLSFFVKSGLRPEVLIGDMDSLRRRPGQLVESAEVITYPREKDQTDLELALDLCLERGARRIDIVMPSVGEVDHFLGTIELIRFGSPGKKVDRLERLRVVNHRFEIIALKNATLNFRSCRGDRLSVIPSGGRIRLSVAGTEYDVTGLLVRPGESRALRNKIVSNRAFVRVEGEALVYHGFDRSDG